MRSICRGLDHLKYINIKSGHRTDIQSCVCLFIFRPKQWQLIMIIIQVETKPHMKKKTWHQNSRCKIREGKKKTASIYSRVVLENVIRCTAVDMRYLTDAAYIDKLVT